MLKIYIADNRSRAEIESIEKGCRSDVLVEIDGRYYKPFVNTIERLSQEVNDSFIRGETFDIDPCQIIVKKASINAIIETLVELSRNNFFDFFVPVNLKNLYKPLWLTFRQ